MIERILNFSVTQRFFVVLLVAAPAAFGVRSLQRLPIDAVPDITNNQVQINTVAPRSPRSRSRSRSPSRIETALAGIPGLEYTRSLSRNGFCAGHRRLQDEDRHLLRPRSRSTSGSPRQRQPAAGRRAAGWGRSRPGSARSTCGPSSTSTRRQGRADRRGQAGLAKRRQLPDAGGAAPARAISSGRRICARCRTGSSARS